MSEVFRIEFFGCHTNQGIPVFTAGQQVQARLILHLSEPMKARRISLHVSGKAEVHWTESETRTSRDIHGHQQSQTDRIHFRSDALYMDQKAALWTPPSGEQQEIAQGQHQFPFTFTLPAHCPPSFEGDYGHIRYHCAVTIDRPWKFDKKLKADFLVAPFVDLNSMEMARQPVNRQIEKSIGFFLFKHGKLGAQIRLPKSGFIPGEPIPIQIDIDNGTSKQVKRVKVRLIENATFVAQKDYVLHYNLCSTTTWGSSTQHFGQRLTSHKVGAPLEQSFIVAPQSKGTYQGEFPVPACVPSFNSCPLIRVDYVLEIKLETNAAMGSSCSVEIPLLIGTVPILRADFINRQPDTGGITVGTTGGIGMYPTLNNNSYPQPTAPPLDNTSVSASPYPVEPPPPYPY